MFILCADLDPLALCFVGTSSSESELSSVDIRRRSATVKRFEAISPRSVGVAFSLASTSNVSMTSWHLAQMLNQGLPELGTLLAGHAGRAPGDPFSGYPLKVRQEQLQD